MTQADADRRIVEADARGKDALARGEEATAGLAKANAAIAEQTTRAASFERDAALARLDAERIKQAIAWRVLSTTHMKAIVRNAGKPQALNIRYTDGDPEALALAMQFATAFGEARWTVGMGAAKLSNALAFGIIVSQGDDAERMTRALWASSISFAVAPIPTRIEFSVSRVTGPTLFVGSKPR